MSDVREKSLNFWCNAMLAAIGLISVLAILMIVPPHPSISYFNFILYGHVGFPETMSADGVRYAVFLYELLACVMIGWMVPLAYLINGPLRRESRAAWNVIALSIGSWYSVDSGVSLALGYWQNALSNTSLAILFAIPLFMMRSNLSHELEA